VFSPNTLCVKPSKCLTTFIAVFASLMLISLYFIQLPLPWFLFFVILVIIYAIYNLGLYAWLLWPFSITKVSMQLDGDGQLQMAIENKSGEWLPVAPQEDTLITPSLSVLVIKAKGNPKRVRRKKILLTADNCDPDQYRQFRVLIRFAKSDQSKDERTGTLS